MHNVLAALVNSNDVREMDRGNELTGAHAFSEEFESEFTSHFTLCIKILCLKVTLSI